jgi:hypothetical protein
MLQTQVKMACPHSYVFLCSVSSLVEICTRNLKLVKIQGVTSLITHFYNTEQQPFYNVALQLRFLKFVWIGMFQIKYKIIHSNNNNYFIYLEHFTTSICHTAIIRPSKDNLKNHQYCASVLMGFHVLISNTYSYI